MYAIIEDGSRQYRVEEGGTVVIDFRDVKPGEAIELGRVLLVQNGETTKIGQPLVEGAKVVGEVVGLPTKKVQVQKFRRRKNYRRLRGHTQPYVRVLVKQIVGG